MQEEQTTWQYTGGDQPLPGDAMAASQEPISWTASEYVAHEKPAHWYAALMGGVATLTVVVYLINRDILTAIAIMSMGICVAVLAGRKPAAKSYTLSAQGITVDQKRYAFGEFSSFSVVEEGAIDSIWLKPLARFTPFLIIYFAPEDEEKIITMLSDFLPHEQRELDAVDRLTRRLRF